MIFSTFAVWITFERKNFELIRTEIGRSVIVFVSIKGHLSPFGRIIRTNAFPNPTYSSMSSTRIFVIRYVRCCPQPVKCERAPDAKALQNHRRWETLKIHRSALLTENEQEPVERVLDHNEPSPQPRLIESVLSVKTLSTMNDNKLLV